MSILEHLSWYSASDSLKVRHHVIVLPEIDVLLVFLSYIWKQKSWLVGSGGPSIFSAVVPSFFPLRAPCATRTTHAPYTEHVPPQNKACPVGVARAKPPGSYLILGLSDFGRRCVLNQQLQA